MTTYLEQTNKMHGISRVNREMATQNNNFKRYKMSYMGNLVPELGRYGQGSVRTLVDRKKENLNGYTQNVDY